MKAGRGNIKYTFTTKTRDRQKKRQKKMYVNVSYYNTR